MRIDKYLQVARLVKKRESAKQLCLLKRAWINGRLAKPGSEVEVGDELRLQFGNRLLTIKILEIRKQVSKKEASSLFEITDNRILEDHEDNS